MVGEEMAEEPWWMLRVRASLWSIQDTSGSSSRLLCPKQFLAWFGKASMEPKDPRVGPCAPRGSMPRITALRWTGQLQPLHCRISSWDFTHSALLRSSVVFEISRFQGGILANESNLVFRTCSS